MICRLNVKVINQRAAKKRAAEEEAARKKAAEEAARKRAAEEAARRRAAEEAARKKAAEDAARKKPAKKEEKSGSLGTFLLIGALLLIGYHNIHIWKPATDTEPETCRICGKTVCEAKGHTWEDANCTDPKTCSVCGETEGAALGHLWVDATYFSPRRCMRCELTEGDVKGWVGYVSGSTTEGTVSVGGNDTHPLMFDTPGVTWRKMTVVIKIDNITGDPYGSHSIYAYNSAQGWFPVQDFTFTSDNVGQDMRFELLYPDGLQIDGLAHVCNKLDTAWHYTYWIHAEEAQQL